MTLFLKFGDSRSGAPSPPGPVYPAGTMMEYEGQGVYIPMLNGQPLHATQIVETNPRPFVPSLAPEDLEKGHDVGALTPRRVNSSLDADAAPFVVPKLPSWASKARGTDDATAHAAAHEQLLNDIAFLQLQSEHEDHESMMEEAADWLYSQEKILWSLPGVPSVIADCTSIALAERLPSVAVQEVKIVRVESTWSLASIAGQTSVYIPWGYATNVAGPPGIKQPLLNCKPLRPHEFVLVEMEFRPQGRNLWRATKIHPKLPTEQMLTSIVESVTDYDGVERSGFSYQFDVPLDPENIGLIIGGNGKNLNSLIQGIQRQRVKSWYGPMPMHIDCENCDFPLPEVTITPIEGPERLSGPSAHKPTKALVSVYLPTCCIWDQVEVVELVSYFHS
tara:strand:+ start:1511 stop:2683 length:1173 start_codon:yes stop_codon:yes gene_type:complete